MLVVIRAWNPSLELPYGFLALVLGVCAASSGDLDDLLPIVVGGFALALLRESSLVAALALAAQACGVALVIAVAARLLLSHSSSETEQRIFAIALLLLLGGAADYLSLSALLSGLTAGLFLEWMGGAARDHVRRDVAHVQHPLLVLVLLVTGARVEFVPAWLGLGAAYLFFRAAAKLAGGWMAWRIADPQGRRAPGFSLLSPGIVGIAFALNVLRAAGVDAAPVLAVVVFGAIGSDVFAALVAPREEPA
jgi:hypothetical protein